MTKSEALHKFWSSFGIKAYDANTVPDTAREIFPRITYDVATDSFGNEVALTASIWDRNMSWVRAEEIKDEISGEIGDGGVNAPYKNGMIWIKRGTPFATRMSDTDDSIRRILLNIEVEYIGG